MSQVTQVFPSPAQLIVARLEPKYGCVVLFEQFSFESVMLHWARAQQFFKPEVIRFLVAGSWFNYQFTAGCHQCTGTLGVKHFKINAFWVLAASVFEQSLQKSYHLDFYHVFIASSKNRCLHCIPYSYCLFQCVILRRRNSFVDTWIQFHTCRRPSYGGLIDVSLVNL